MEDVVLHYRPGSTQNLSALIETTERLLAPFPCRPPQVFTPWFPSIDDQHLPLRPARPAPIILSAPDQDYLTENRDQTGPSGTEVVQKHVHTENKTENRTSPEADKHGAPLRDKEVLCVPETPADAVPVRSTFQSPVKRRWTVFKQKKDQRQVQPMSQCFHHTVSRLRLQPQQRVKWLIDRDNCRDVEQVWRVLTRSGLGCSLPTCNAHIDRERAQVWIYCDVLYSEQVGLFLKRELRLTGSISLSVHKLGNIYSL